MTHYGRFLIFCRLPNFVKIGGGYSKFGPAFLLVRLLFDINFQTSIEGLFSLVLLFFGNFLSLCQYFKHMPVIWRNSYSSLMRAPNTVSAFKPIVSIVDKETQMMLHTRDCWWCVDGCCYCYCCCCLLLAFCGKGSANNVCLHVRVLPKSC